MTDEQAHDTPQDTDISIEAEEAEHSGLQRDESTTVQKLKKQLAACQSERAEYLDGWQRLKADMANNKKSEGDRLTCERERGVEAVLESLLPALDSFDAARQGSAWEEVSDAWRQGMGFVYTQLTDALEQHGVRAFGAPNEAFDPTRHEAAEGEGETIKAVLRKGYTIGERVIRPARVTLG